MNNSDILWDYLMPWVKGKLISLVWTYVSAMASYSPFLLMTLLENKMEDMRLKKFQQMQLRAREDYAIEEVSAYKDGDEVDQYLKPGETRDEAGLSEREEQEDEEEEEEAKD